MGINFEFTTANRIIFGRGSISKIPHIIEEFGERVLLVTGKNPARADILIKEFQALNTMLYIYRVESEPSVSVIDEGVKQARENRCEMVVGIGGGSVIDSAKAIAALATNRGELLDYLEVIGKGKKLEQKPLPFIAVPTTAGTGAEASKNSVIWSPEHKVKVSLRSPLMFADVALVDPELTLSMSPDVTATTGMDALTHLLETFVSNQSNPFIDNFCREGMRRIARSLTRACNNGRNLEAREDMSMASLLGGMALANVKLGAVHGFAGPMGGMLPVPHGAVCACLLPAVMEANYSALLAENQQEKLGKFDEIGQLLTGKPDAVAKDGISWVTDRMSELKIPGLSEYGLSENDFPELIKKAKKASSMKGNPVVLDDAGLNSILTKSA